MLFEHSRWGAVLGTNEIKILAFLWTVGVCLQVKEANLSTISKNKPIVIGRKSHISNTVQITQKKDFISLDLPGDSTVPLECY